LKGSKVRTIFPVQRNVNFRYEANIYLSTGERSVRLRREERKRRKVRTRRKRRKRRKKRERRKRSKSRKRKSRRRWRRRERSSVRRLDKWAQRHPHDHHHHHTTKSTLPSTPNQQY
jgi:hypothetical protein